MCPDVACPVERRWSIRSRVASAMPIESSLKRFPFGAMTSAPVLTHRPRAEYRSHDDCAWACALSDPVVRGVRTRPDDNPLDLLRARDRDRTVRDHENPKPIPRSDAVDLVLHRTGVGVDEDAQLIIGPRRSDTPAVCRPNSASRQGQRQREASRKREFPPLH